MIFLDAINSINVKMAVLTELYPLLPLLVTVWPQFNILEVSSICGNLKSMDMLLTLIQSNSKFSMPVEYLDQIIHVCEIINYINTHSYFKTFNLIQTIFNQFRKILCSYICTDLIDSAKIKGYNWCIFCLNSNLNIYSWFFSMFQWSPSIYTWLLVSHLIHTSLMTF